MFGNAFFFSSSGLILDGLNSSAAYSLRKLRTAYLGAAINVRRSSDSATQDIGFATAAQTRTNLAAIPINNNTGQSASGVTMTTVGTGTEFGQPYVDVRWQGTAGSGAFLTLGHGARGVFNPTLQAPVTPGLNYTASVGYRLLAGTPPTTTFYQVDALFFSATGAFIVAASSTVPPATAALQRSAAIGVAPAGAAYVQPIWRVFAATGTVVDFTMRFYAANVEQAIGNARPLLQRNVPETVAAIGELDAEALLSFVGNGNGFVRTWYDQSGNGRNATQTTAAGQPQIVINGVIQTQNGRPTVAQSIQDQTLPISAPFTGLTSATGVFVFRQLTGNAGAHGFRFQAGGVNNHAPWQDGRAYDSFFSSIRQVFNNYGPASSPSTTTLTTHTVRQTGTALQVFKNGVQIDGNKTVSFQLPDAPSLFTLSASGGIAAVSEAIVFGTALSTTDRQAIESNQMQYYGIGNCGADYDFTFLSGQGMPGFQGNCFLVTNEQIRWLQLNGYIPNTSTAPNNKTCPTKSQFEGYIGGFDLNGSSEYTALANNNCVPIGYWYPNL